MINVNCSRKPRKANTRRKTHKHNAPRKTPTWTSTSSTTVPMETVLKGLSVSQMETLTTLTKQATELKAQTWTEELVDLCTQIVHVLFSSTTLTAPNTPTQ
jgi:hypothetical protein